MAECDGSPKQNWVAHPDRSFRALGKCLDVTNDANANGTMHAFGWCLDLAFADTSDFAPLQLHDCNSTIAQKWKIAV